MTAGAGAADRTSFFEFQAKNRRATWRLTAVCALVVGGAGLVAALGLLVNLVLVVFALFFIPAVLLLGLGFLASLTPITGVLARPLWATAALVLGGFGILSRLWSSGPETVVVVAGLLALGSWLAVWQVGRAAGVGHALLAMGAREPVPGDLEERQLGNLVTEMAIAAGVAPPAVRLLDGEVVNAAAVGFEGGERYVVVARRLLDEFDRDETQAVVAHLVAAIGNGDLRGAAQIQALLYLLDLLLVVALAPFASLPRRVARRWLGFPFRAPGLPAEQRAEDARQLIALLAAHRAALPADPERGDRPGSAYFGRVGGVLIRVVPPLLALVLFGVVAIAVLLMAASVPVALLWRSRRYLADATAVQLTRNPTGLHRALTRLAECGARVPGGERLAYLFIVGPEVFAARRWLEELHARARFRASGALRRGPAGLPAPPPSAPARGALGEYEGVMMGMQPAVRRRLDRLVRMGASPPDAAGLEARKA